MKMQDPSGAETLEIENSSTCCNTQTLDLDFHIRHWTHRLKSNWTGTVYQLDFDVCALPHLLDLASVEEVDLARVEDVVQVRWVGSQLPWKRLPPLVCRRAATWSHLSATCATSGRYVNLWQWHLYLPTYNTYMHSNLKKSILPGSFRLKQHDYYIKDYQIFVCCVDKITFLFLPMLPMITRQVC